MTTAEAARAGEPVLPPGRLERYADTLRRSCLRLGDGDELYVHAEPAHPLLVDGTWQVA